MGKIRSGTLAAFVFGSALAVIGSQTLAGCIGPMVNGKCLGTETGSPYTGEPTNQGSGYRSSTGTQYQYNNNNPIDRDRYLIDLDAQRRDQLSVDPRRDLDRSSGQNGGGIGGCQTWPCR